MIDLKTRFFPDACTFHNIYKLQKHVLLRHQSYQIVFMGIKNLNCKNVQHVKIYKKRSTVENVRQLCEELFLLKCILLLTFTAFGYSNNQRETTLLQKVKWQKQNFENHWHLCFSTAMLIIYIKRGTPAQHFWGSAMTRATFVCFFTEVIKFYWLMLLLYPGELYRLLGASSL